MSAETVNQDLSGVAETMLATLYLRAMESQRPDALSNDEKAVALVTQMSYNFDRVRQIPMSEANKLVIILRNREFDRYARDFMARHPEAVVVHIGCGLDTRFERVDNGKVEWYDLDFPHIIEVRRKLIGDERERYYLLGCSVLENAWLETVSAHHQCPFLFLAEGVSVYLEEAQVKWLVQTLRERFPGAELVFDAFSPFHVWRSNLQLSFTKSDVRFHWGIWHGEEIEGWAEGIRLLDDWGFLDPPEPRLARIRWLRHIPLVARSGRIYHFRLGKAAG